MPFLLAEILNFQGSTHLIGVGSLSLVYLVGLVDLSRKRGGLSIRPTDKGFADSPHGQGTCRFIPRTSGSPILPANEEDIDIPEISKRKNDIPAIILFT